MKGPMAMSERDWQAECDARTLSEAEAIKKDADRFNKAQTAAARLLKEKEEEAKALADLAGAKMVYDKSDLGEYGKK